MRDGSAQPHPPDAERHVWLAIWRARLRRAGFSIVNKKDKSKLPDRKHPVHMPPVERHNQPVILFVTLAVKPRGNFLASQSFHLIFVDACRDADAWRVGRYVIMPDHVHLFCAPNRYPCVSVLHWTRFLKERITKRLNESIMEGEAAPSRKADRRWKWQPDCWDTQMRSSDHYHEKWLYARDNPVRAELVDNVDQWPFQGELNLLRW